MKANQHHAPMLALCVALACASSPEDQGSGIAGFEPSVEVTRFDGQPYFVLDSIGVAVISGDRFLVAPTFLLVDRAMLDYRRYLEDLPRRTAVALVTQPKDSAPVDSLARASKAPLIIRERVNLPRDNRGRILPVSRFLVASITNSVVRGWLLASDTTVRDHRPPDWILAGVTQLVTGFPSSRERAAQLASQAAQLVPLDTLMTMTIPENAIRAGLGPESGLTGNPRGGLPSPRAQGDPPRLDRQQLAAIQAASLLEFMWAREGRSIVKRTVDATRRGQPLSSVLETATSLPKTVAGLDSVWRESVIPKKRG